MLGKATVLNTVNVGCSTFESVRYQIKAEGLCTPSPSKSTLSHSSYTPKQHRHCTSNAPTGKPRIPVFPLLQTVSSSHEVIRPVSTFQSRNFRSAKYLQILPLDEHAMILPLYSRMVTDSAFLRQVIRCRRSVVAFAGVGRLQLRLAGLPMLA